MWKVIASSVVGGALVLVCVGSGCGSDATGGFSCEGNPKCTGDPAPTEASRALCRAALAGACGTKYRALGECGVAKGTCTGGGTSGTTDLTNCAAEQKGFTDCLAANTDAGLDGAIDSGGNDGAVKDASSSDAADASCKANLQPCASPAECCSNFCNDQGVCMGGN